MIVGVLRSISNIYALSSPFYPFLIIAKIIYLVDPKLYKNYLTPDKNSQTMLYVNLHQALYVFLISVLIFDRKLVMGLDEYGFKLNAYYPFAVNKMINGHQITVMQHINYFKVSNKDPFYINSYSKCSSHIYG